MHAVRLLSECYLAVNDVRNAAAILSTFRFDGYTYDCRFVLCLYLTTRVTVSGFGDTHDLQGPSGRHPSGEAAVVR